MRNQLAWEKPTQTVGVPFGGPSPRRGHGETAW